MNTEHKFPFCRGRLNFAAVLVTILWAFFARDATAATNDADALFAAGERYFFGTGTTQDFVAAFSAFDKAGDNGHAAGKYSAALMSSQGWGVPRERAIWLMRRAAEMGAKSAEYDLAWLYTDVTNRNLVEAANWLRAAGNHGDRRAQNNLGIFYAKGGLGLTQNDQTACDWLELASGQGDTFAKRILVLVRYRMSPQEGVAIS